MPGEAGGALDKGADGGDRGVEGGGREREVQAVAGALACRAVLLLNFV